MKATTISKDYLIFTGLIFCIIMVLCLLTGLTLHKSYFDNLNKKTLIQQSIIEQEFNKSINEMYRYIEFLGRKVSEEDFRFSENSAYLFKRQHTLDINLTKDSFVHWGSFRLLNLKGDIIVSGGDDYQVNYNKDILEQSAKNPWAILFASPTKIGKYAGFDVVPVVVGITDESGKYLGTISTVVLLDIINNKIQEILKQDSNIFYEILDKSRNLLLSSTANHNSQANVIVSEQENNTYPVLIKVGYNKKAQNSKFIASLNKYLATLGIVGLSMVVLLYFFYRKLVSPIIKLSNYAKKISKDEPAEIAIDSISQEFNELTSTLQSIEKYKRNLVKTNYDLLEKTKDLENMKVQLETVLKTHYEADDAKAKILKEIRMGTRSSIEYLSQALKLLHTALNDDTAAPKSQLESIIEKMKAEIDNISTFTAGSLNKVEIDVEQLLNQCLAVTKKVTDRRNIQIKYFEPESLGTITADRTRLYQVITSLLRRATEFLNEGHTLLVDPSKSTIAGVEYFVLRIEDDGFGLPEEKRKHLSKSMQKDIIEGVDLTTELVNKLVELHDGKLDVIDKWKKGSEITLMIPYKTLEQENPYQADSKIVTINFRKKK